MTFQRRLNVVDGSIILRQYLTGGSLRFAPTSLRTFRLKEIQSIKDLVDPKPRRTDLLSNLQKSLEEMARQDRGVVHSWGSLVEAIVDILPVVKSHMEQPDHHRIIAVGHPPVVKVRRHPAGIGP